MSKRSIFRPAVIVGDDGSVDVEFADGDYESTVDELGDVLGGDEVGDAAERHAALLDSVLGTGPVPEALRRLADALDGGRPPVVVTVDGGVVQAVVSRDGGEQVVLVNYDRDDVAAADVGDDGLVQVPQPGSGTRPALVQVYRAGPAAAEVAGFAERTVADTASDSGS